jgi:hypothetical protein
MPVPDQEPAAQAGHACCRAAGRMIGLVLGPGGLAGECAAARLHLVAGEILAAAIIIVPLLTGTILVTVVVFGGTRSSDRVFRLLRWFSDNEEPPAPALSPSAGSSLPCRSRMFCDP